MAISSDQQLYSSSCVSTIDHPEKFLDEELRKVCATFIAQSSHLDPEESRKRWMQMTTSVFTQISRLDLANDNPTAQNVDMGFETLTWKAVPVVVVDPTPDITGSVPQAIKGTLPATGGTNHGNDAVASSSLQPPKNKHKTNSSISSAGTGYYSLISDKELEPHELPAPLKLFALLPNSSTVGQEFFATIDTAHLSGAPLLRQGTAKEFGWRVDSSVAISEEKTSVKCANGSELPILGNIELDTQILNKEGTIVLKKRITYHVVPNKTIHCDCLLNWKLLFLFKRLQQYVFT